MKNATVTFAHDGITYTATADKSGNPIVKYKAPSGKSFEVGSIQLTVKALSLLQAAVK